jgi:hypothetical protein
MPMPSARAATLIVTEAASLVRKLHYGLEIYGRKLRRNTYK